MSDRDLAVTRHLESFLTPRRRERLEQVLADRTRWATVVLEDVYHTHNLSAVLRSCDAFGIQDVHIIEREHQFDVNPKVALGAEQWLSVQRYQSERAEEECVAVLRAEGRRLFVACPHAAAASPDELPLDRPVALVFGTEKDGVSDSLRRQADGFVSVPMVGFVESFNVSVAAAICLSAIRRRLERSADPAAWRLSPLTRVQIGRPNDVNFRTVSFQQTHVLLRRFYVYDADKTQTEIRAGLCEADAHVP